MKKSFVKAIALASMLTLFSANLAFANDNVEVNLPGPAPFYNMDADSWAEDNQQGVKAGTIFEIHGGHGEWGYGALNMWGKYWHMTKSHRVVLMKDNSNVYGAWEDAGPTESYRDARKGSNMNATGEVR